MYINVCCHLPYSIPNNGINHEFSEIKLFIQFYFSRIGLGDKINIVTIYDICLFITLVWFEFICRFWLCVLLSCLLFNWNRFSIVVQIHSKKIEKKAL